MLERIFFIAVIVGFAAFATLQSLTPQAADAPSPPAIIPVQVMSVLPQPLNLSVRSQGTVLPRAESKLVAEVAGRIVYTSPALVAGGSFEVGDVLLRLDDTQTKQALKQADAQLERALAEYEHARYEKVRADKLRAQKLISTADHQDAQRQLQIADSARIDALQRQKNARRDLSRTVLQAPFDGQVRAESVDVGQFVGRGTTIATLFADEAVEVRLPVPDRDLAALDLPLDKRGELEEEQQVDVTLTTEYAGQDWQWQGKIVRTSAQIDTGSRMIHLIARVAGDEVAASLPVGLYVNAEIAGRELAQAIVVPRAALRRQEQQVFLVDGDDRLRSQAVSFQHLDRERVLITAGLEGGERLILGRVVTPVEGMFVAPEPIQPPLIPAAVGR